MKIIAPIIQFYESMLRNETTEHILEQLNAKEKLLFNKVLKGEIKSDKQAASLLYDGNPSGQAYCKFKQSLLNKLLRIVINFSNNQGSAQRQKFLDLQRDFHAFNIMLFSTMKESGMQLGKKILIQADRLDENHIGMFVARYLGGHFWTNHKDEKEGRKYWDKYEYFRKRFEVNARIVKYYSELMLHSKKKDYNEPLHLKAVEYEKIVRELATKDNPKSMQFYYQICYVIYASISEHKGVIENNLKALKYFDSLKHEFQAAKDLLKVQLVIAYLGIGQYEEATRYLDIDPQEVGDEKWFEKMATKIRIYFNLGKFDESNKLINQIIDSVRFKQTSVVIQEQYWLYKYYAELMIFYETGISVKTRKIRNNMTRLTADKKGYNVSYFIAEIIEALQSDGVKVIYKMEDSIKNYIKYYLKDSHNDRSIIFMKFLLSLPNSIYDEHKFYSSLNQTKEKFQEIPASFTTKPDNEIIPYETLMNSILSNHVQVSTKSRTLSLGGSAASDNQN